MVSGTKTWIDPEGTEHPAITINLLRDGVRIDSVTLENGNTAYSFDNLAKYDLTNGHVYAYTVEEEAVEGYTTTYSPDTLAITNTIEQDNTVVVSGTKTWIDPEGTEHPAITINLLRDGVRIDSVTLENGETAYSFDDLAKYDLMDGHVYEYTLADYEVTYAPLGTVNANSEERTITVTNEIHSDMAIVVSKTWQNELGVTEDRPEIAYTLMYKTTAEDDDDIVVAGPLTALKEENYGVTFENVPALPLGSDRYYVVETMTGNTAAYYTTNSPATVVVGENGAAAELVNTRKLGKLIIRKDVTDNSLQPVDKAKATFDAQYTVVNGANTPIKVEGGLKDYDTNAMEVSYDLPYGAEVVVEEIFEGNAGNAWKVTYQQADTVTINETNQIVTIGNARAFFNSTPDPDVTPIPTVRRTSTCARFCTDMTWWRGHRRRCTRSTRPSCSAQR